MLYEGNPDSTNIRERFRYNFEVQTAQPQPEPATNGVEPEPSGPADAATAATAAVDVPAPDAAMTNGEKDAVAPVNPEVTVKSEGEEQPPAAAPDVDMEGTT